MWIQLDGKRVYAYTGGRPFDPARPTIAFVHGAQHDHSVWILQSRYLAHHGFSVLAFDLPGHGRSEGPLLTTVEAMADWLLAALAAVGAERAMIAGHSMGSLIALEAAGKAPARVDRIALVGSVFPMPVSDVLLDAARNDEPRAFQMINRWSHYSLYDPPSCPGPGMSIWHQNLALMARQRSGVLLNDFSACNAYQAGFERADALACPVLFVLGSRDQMTPPKAARPLVQRCAAALAGRGLPAPQVVEVPDCGHALMAERPQAVLDALHDFARSTAPA
jgi:pimeloyl-ACP methyl ester carboxylesterase